MKCISRASNAVLATAVMMLAACTVGPDFERPRAPATASITATPLPDETVGAPGIGGAPQRLISGGEISAEWWDLFHSPALDQVIRQAMRDNPTLAAAQAALRNARENLRAREGTVYFPALDAAGSVSREKSSGSAIGQPGQDLLLTLYNASVNVTYALDLFGSGRRELEGLRAQVDVQRFLRAGTFLTLSGNIVTTAISEASLRGQLQTTLELLAIQEKQLDLVQQQFQLGAVASSDVLAQQSLLAQTQATVPPLEKTLAQTRHLLAVLTGRLPNEAAHLPEFSLDQLQLPEELPLSLPAELIRRRPDILVSEALLHAASAQIGVTTANLLPQIMITGSYGSEANRPGKLFNNGTSVWNIGTGLLQPIFHGGELRANRRAAMAAYDQALAQYRETVLFAFQNVADVLRALETDARALQAQAAAADSARKLLDLTRQQFEVGAVNYLSLFNAQRQYQQARLTLVQAQAIRFADTAALFQALGGGWQSGGLQTDRIRQDEAVSQLISREKT